VKKTGFQQKADARIKRKSRKKAQPDQAREATEETTERKAAKPLLSQRQVALWVFVRWFRRRRLS